MSKSKADPKPVWPFSSVEDMPAPFPGTETAAEKPKKTRRKKSDEPTLAEQEALLKVLKFTPRDYTISTYGYGGEYVMGTVKRESYDYFQENELDIEDYAHDWDNELDVPEDKQPFDPGQWHDCDNIAHVYGVELSDYCGFQITDEKGNTVFETNLDYASLEAQGIEAEEYDEHYASNQESGTVVYTGQSSEKGNFFSATIHLTEPFDPKKLKFSYEDFDGVSVVTGASYDGEDLEDDGNSSTSGKGMYHTLTLVE